jgi:hypothetical protein
MPPADVFFLGTSKIRTTVMPEVIEGTLSSRLGREVRIYCFGQNGSNPNTSRLVLDDAIAAHGLPAAIVLEVSPGAFNRNHGHVVRDLRFYSSLADIAGAVRWIDTRDRLKAAAAGSFRGLSSLTRYGSRWLYPGQFEPELSRHQRRRGAQFPPTARKYHRRLSDRDPAARQALLDTAIPYARTTYLDRYSVGGAPMAGFQRIIGLAAAEGIPVVLVEPPVTPAYRAAICTDDEHAAFRMVIEESLTDSHPPVVEADLSGVELTDRDFLDLTHLHPDGATKVSRHLAQTVLLPLLQNPKTF